MSKSVYQDIYADMQQAIEHGDYPYQSYLPSENELKELYGCSRTTVRRALAALAAEGYVQPQQGRGVCASFAMVTKQTAPRHGRPRDVQGDRRAARLYPSSPA